MDFQAYLASGSSGEGSEGEDEDEGTTEEQQIQKYRVCVNSGVCVWGGGGGGGGELTSGRVMGE